MKIVREYINEKFEETSDPVSDMHIGQDYFKHKIAEFWPDRFGNFGLDYAEYCRAVLFSKEAAVIPTKDNFGNTQYIIKYNGRDKITFFNSALNLFRFNKNTDTQGNVITRMALSRYKNQLAITLDDANKLHTNEAFSEKSDPIKDMNVGIEKIVSQIESSFSELMWMDTVRKDIITSCRYDGKKLELSISQVNYYFMQNKKDIISYIERLMKKLDLLKYFKDKVKLMPILRQQQMPPYVAGAGDIKGYKFIWSVKPEYQTLFSRLNLVD